PVADLGGGDVAPARGRQVVDAGAGQEAADDQQAEQDVHRVRQRPRLEEGGGEQQQDDADVPAHGSPTVSRKSWPGRPAFLTILSEPGRETTTENEAGPANATRTVQNPRTRK